MKLSNKGREKRYVEGMEWGQLSRTHLQESRRSQYQWQTQKLLHLDLWVAWPCPFIYSAVQIKCWLILTPQQNVPGRQIAIVHCLSQPLSVHSRSSTASSIWDTTDCTSIQQKELRWILASVSTPGCKLQCLRTPTDSYFWHRRKAGQTEMAVTVLANPI